MEGILVFDMNSKYKETPEGSYSVSINISDC